MKSIAIIVVLVGLLLSGCDSTSSSLDDDSGPTADVSVNFKLLTPRGAKQLAGSLVQGTNGTIELEDVRFIIAELELEAEDGDCGEEGDDDDCPEFEIDPTFFQLPLAADEVTVAVSAIPLGTYDELEFEIEDLEDDPGDADYPASAELLTQIRVTDGFSDWPDEASMILTGTFTPTGGSPESFRVYAEAEVEVEIDLDPPLVVDAETTDYSVNVSVSPSDWLVRPDGTVIDMREFDFASTAGKLLEFEVEFENGFKEVDIDDD